MSDYISRESAVVRACKVVKDDCLAFDVKEAIDSIPAADVVPGRWIPVEERLPEPEPETKKEEKHVVKSKPAEGITANS